MFNSLNRRHFLRAGAVSTAVSMSGWLGKLAMAAEASKTKPKRACILLWMNGGPSTIDMWDLKPGHENGGGAKGFKEVETSVPGLRFSEHLPKLAKCGDKYTILRGVSHTLAAHELGTLYMNTGNRPLPSLEYPSLGSVVSKELAAPPDMPPFVAVPNTPQGGGFLGLQYGAFSTNAQPKLGSPFNVRGIGLSGGVTLTEIDRREKLLAKVDSTFRAVESKSDVLSGLDEFSEQAYNMISSKRAREAFDVAREDQKVAKRFGDGEMNQSALLAVRLVEAGARFVTLTTGSWDMHTDIYSRLDKSLPMVDQTLSALLTTLDERGLLETTAVIMTGEFGRTPKINQRGGRDHWPRAMFVVMAGGGVKGGQVIGASDDKGQGPANEAITPDDVAASFLSSLGIDTHKEYQTSSGRPIMISRDGKVIPGLYA